ncbi:hypothetical protein P2_00030 [Escherichia phage YJin-2024a]
MAVYIALLGYALSLIVGMVIYSAIGNIVLSLVVCTILGQFCGMFVIYKLMQGK